MSDYKTVHVSPDVETTASTGDSEDGMSNTMRLNRKELAVPVVVQQRAYLEVGGLGKETISVELDKDEFTIGRHPSCDVHLPLTNISRTHAHVVCVNGEYFVEDLGSTNGTYVNSVKIVRCVLRNNDMIEIGDAKILFVEEKTRRS
jgi:pSer/pThr/pTyr-binding forkhead associated (FHA) protein